MNPDHTPREAAAAELARFDRIATQVADAPVRMVAPMLRECLEDVCGLVDYAYRHRGLADPPAPAIIREPSGAGDAENVPTPGPSTEVTG